MSDCVVDSSVAVKLALAEPDSAKAHQVAAEVTAAGGRLYLLDLALAEIANAIRTCHHRGLISVSEAKAKFTGIRNTQAVILPALPLLPHAFDLSLRFGIAVYDALCVAAVDSLKCDGVTADVPLVTAVGTAFPSIKLLKNW
jgi:predicted nucleic acid-binding protein